MKHAQPTPEYRWAAMEALTKSVTRVPYRDYQQEKEKSQAVENDLVRRRGIEPEPSDYEWETRQQRKRLSIRRLAILREIGQTSARTWNSSPIRASSR
jgi:hypothetical protein